MANSKELKGIMVALYTPWTADQSAIDADALDAHIQVGPSSPILIQQVIANHTSSRTSYPPAFMVSSPAAVRESSPL